ncbi:Pyrrolysyl-tRNA synthetase [Desulfitobacterium dehalogenans ATCC 51507]|uniref:Pyrrolysyl-tRNA synthetase n=1 Tax=Desulfitobacterium dehalogenans (strain ATCC 51507 / DSM 9161 / JW/IU-DC1) TaxID=756499 RepID=I4A4Y9_DESDJ|nr:pyrrolysine--tRNA(Pyl) ligase large subunit [Desulfitobacterium dehalogenans]AFL99023.1 Pyrrolysyl-tRNA synthetase [Desulfitobacterium dehalogenans ATCC 51507]
MTISWSKVQLQRLIELNATAEQLDMSFTDTASRNRAFQDAEYELVKRGKQKLEELRKVKHRPGLLDLEDQLARVLRQHGFVQVVTPTIISKSALAKMTISDEHPLFSQVFWLDNKRCLRPMLAPNLYTLWKDLIRLWEKPIRIFEIGTCYRKESQGAQHLNEFTMLNVTELGTPVEERHSRLEEMAQWIMEAAEIKDYGLLSESSVVYGDTIDVMKGEVELGSGAMGPHFMDEKWGIFDSWVGIGFGLERLLMIREGTQNVQSIARSLTYLDGVRLNIK